MMNGGEKSDRAIVAKKPPNALGRPDGGGGAKGGDRGERGAAKHIPNAESETCDPGAEPRTASRKAEEAGAVHSAPPPCQPRHAAIGVLRAPARGRRGVDGVTWRDYEAELEPRLEDLAGRVHRGAYVPQPSRRVYIPKADGRQRPPRDRPVG